MESDPWMKRRLYLFVERCLYCFVQLDARHSTAILRNFRLDSLSSLSPCWVSSLMRRPSSVNFNAMASE